ncbi:MAG: peptidoglycan DD-metalloendopeptidase family protein [Aquimonas sp.]|nr:peptidoglycan DD-metalloendopeptidase family protein [Aquimonas sp.]
MSALRAMGVGVLLLAVAGCGVAPRAVVVEGPGGAQAGRPSAQPAASSGVAEHVVQRGDTLYGIAFRHGLDYRQVADWNRIGPPHTIFPGQRIRLRPPGAAVAQAPSRPAATAPAAGAAAPASTAPAPSPSAPIAAAPPAASPVSTPPSSTPPAVATQPPAQTRPQPQPPAASGPIRWQWPTRGDLVGRFFAGDPTRQGLSIAGSAGQPVNAAADGVVVYSGSGLIGYGELIIVKHSDEFLSAYGHNRRRLVAEGEQVRAGQQIAEMGRSGAARDMLHFEIRRNGRPVDPLGHLPAR